jgi:hypothetical protein
MITAGGAVQVTAIATALPEHAPLLCMLLLLLLLRFQVKGVTSPAGGILSSLVG